MLVTAKRQGETLFIYADGEIDEHSAPAARRVADSVIQNNLSAKRVVFDLEKVSFMDSSGIGFLLGRFKLCNRFGVAAYIKSPNATADKILEMSGVYALIPKLGGERRTV